MLGYGLFGGVESAASFGSRQKGLIAVAAARDVSVHRAAVAWALSLDAAVIPIVGSRRPNSIRDSTAALQLELTEREMARIGESQVRGQG
jgi:aryl-alcohol dehydrogenase-like predicted oxidoreductase